MTVIKWGKCHEKYFNNINKKWNKLILLFLFLNKINFAVKILKKLYKNKN